MHNSYLEIFTMSNKLQQRGFVLVSVLLITSIATFLALSAIGGVRLQERIAGNQIKEINARARAEKGLLKIVQKIEEMDNNNKTLNEIITALDNSGISGEYSLNIESSTTANVLNIKSEGQYNDAVAYLNAQVFFKSSGETTGSAIISCEAITLAGSGSIDSFDSRDGTYSSNDANSNADVVTINGDVNITGAAKIKGDLTVNGYLTSSGSATFGGDVAANADITLAQATVQGNISSNQNISLTGGTLGNSSTADSGNVSAIGTLTLANNPTSVNTNGKGSVNANGGLIYPNNYDLSRFSEDIQTAGAFEVAMTSNKCNELNIATAMPTVDVSDINTNMDTMHSGANTDLEFNSYNPSIEIFDSTDTTNPLVEINPTTLTSSLWEGNKSVYVFDNFNLNNTMITVVGDVIIMVTGDLITSGGGTGFQFNDGDTDSSLTILIEGKVEIGSSTQIFENATIDSDNLKVPLTIYSSFASSGSDENVNAVYLNGGSDMYAKVYAPLGNIEYAASGSMMGSLEGKNVDISGAGSVHYDEALALFDPTLDDDSGTAKFSSLYYYYPD